MFRATAAVTTTTIRATTANFWQARPLQWRPHQRHATVPPPPLLLSILQNPANFKNDKGWRKDEKPETPKQYVYYFEYRWWKNRVSGLGSLFCNIWAVHLMVSPFPNFASRIFEPIRNNWFTKLIEITLNLSECIHFIFFENLWFGIRNWGNHLMNCLLRCHLEISYVLSLVERKQNMNDWMWSFQQFTQNFNKRCVRNFMFWL